MTAPIQVTVKETEPMLAAFIAMKGPYGQMSDGFGKLYGWIAEKGYVPAGPPSGLFFNAPGQVPEDQLLWEIRSPIAGNVPPNGPDEHGLGVKRLDGAQVVSAIHKGPFDEVAETYAALAAWIAENGYEIIGPVEEVYLSDPQTVPPSELLTEIRFPVRKR